MPTLTPYPVRQIPGIDTMEALEAHLVSRGCYDANENSRIYQKWFAAGPRYIYRAVNRKYRISEMRLADIGCAYGASLIYAPEGSYGLEIESYEVAFARSIGLTVYDRDVFSDLSDLPRVDAVWTSMVMEHVDSPHLFMRQLHRIMNPNGLLVNMIPVVPRVPQLERLPVVGKYFRGWQHDDHANYFTATTLRHIAEHAGFETLEVSAFLPGPLAPFSRWAPLRDMVAIAVYVGRAIPNWDYPERATRRVTPGLPGYRWVGQDFGEDGAGLAD